MSQTDAADQEPHAFPKDTLLRLAFAAADGFSNMAAAAGGGIDDVAGARCWYSLSNVAAFNSAALLSEDQFNSITLRNIRAFFRQQGRSYSVMVLDDLVPGSTQRLNNLGYAQYDHMPAMWLEDLTKLPPESAEEQAGTMQLKAVDSGIDRANFRSILSQVFSMPSSDVDVILTEQAFAGRDMRHYISYTHGVAAAVTTLIIGSGVAGIWNVGTLPQYRRRGAATMLVRHALAEAQLAGCRSSMLLASNQGTPIYERLGYRTVSTLRIFVPVPGSSLA